MIFEKKKWKIEIKWDLRKKQKIWSYLKIQINRGEFVGNNPICWHSNIGRVNFNYGVMQDIMEGNLG